MKYKCTSFFFGVFNFKSLESEGPKPPPPPNAKFPARKIWPYLKPLLRDQMVVHNSLRPAMSNGGKTRNVGVKSSPLLGGDGSNLRLFSHFFQMG